MGRASRRRHDASTTAALEARAEALLRTLRGTAGSTGEVPGSTDPHRPHTPSATGASRDAESAPDAWSPGDGETTEKGRADGDSPACADGATARDAARLVEHAQMLLADASALLAAGPVAGASGAGHAADPTDLLTAIDAAERVKAVVTAVQMRAEVAFRAARIAAQGEQGVPSREMGRGIAEEVALARRISPGRCANQLALRRVVVESLPRTLDHLAAGDVSEWAAEEVAKAVIVLGDADRARIDEDLAPSLPEVSPRRAGAMARALAAELDQAAAVERMRREESERHVTIRPVSDAMVQLSAMMPMAAGVAAFAALDAAAASSRAAGVPGTRGQHMADALFSRITGLEHPSQCDVEIRLLMTDGALLAGAGETAWIDGHPVPAEIARRFALGSDDGGVHGEAAEGANGAESVGLGGPVGDGISGGERTADGERGRRFIRRLYTDPPTGRLRDADARRRRFTGQDRRLVEMTYQRCAMPWCEAPIRHIDHVERHADGGPTTVGNGAGVCEHCNYLLERPGWNSRMVPEGEGSEGEILEVRSPTGRVHRCPPPPLRRPVASGPVSGAPPGSSASLPSISHDGDARREEPARPVGGTSGGSPGADRALRADRGSNGASRTARRDAPERDDPLLPRPDALPLTGFPLRHRAHTVRPAGDRRARIGRPPEVRGVQAGEPNHDLARSSARIPGNLAAVCDPVTPASLDSLMAVLVAADPGEVVDGWEE